MVGKLKNDNPAKVKTSVTSVNKELMIISHLPAPVILTWKQTFRHAQLIETLCHLHEKGVFQ
jgi:hypothetical protein